MAEASIQFLLDNLKSLLQEEIGLITGVKQEVIKLSSTLTAVQAVVEDAEQKQLESKPIRDWLCKLNDLTYEIEDILDEYTTEVSVSKLEHKSSKLSRYSLKKILKKILSRHKMGKRMKQVNGKLDTISTEREKFHLREMGIERKSNYAATRETTSFLNESEHIYGRDKEKEDIVDILVKGDCDERQLSVLPVLGLGGLGKTTLARLVFNDKKVDEHFDMKIWVCVSDDFDVKTLIKAMIEYTTSGKESCSDLPLTMLQHRLLELLNQKRFLLVLDDVWNEDQEKWSTLKNAVACGSKGATIVVTTRLQIVADIMGTLPAHHIEGLSEENCWLLFKERAFGQEKEERVNLEGIGRQIVEKCCGVPLAAKALGGLVRFKRTEKEWLHVLNSEIWNLPQDTLLLPALQLSYHHLPLELRRCFAYCAVFPKDTEIDKDELIFRWMGHGYISSYGRLEEEDIGNAIWNELVLRSLFQDVKEGTKRTTFTMHDLVHDLAQSVMENKVPRIQAQLNDKAASKDFRIREVNLRKHRVAFPCRIQPKIDLSYSLKNLNRLRALDASYTRIDSIPSTIGNLKHLRYLNLSDTEIDTLPDAICSLWNLKILNLNHCRDLVGLPKQMRILRNLRHLLLENCGSLDEMPPKMGELSSLKTLSLFVVGVGKGKGLDDLQFLNIGGKLRIRHLERVLNHMDANMTNLPMKENLRELRLEWEDDKTCENMDEDVLKALEPHPNIKIIRIRGFRGNYFPRWWITNSSLVNLVEFYLHKCPNCCSLGRMGELPHLKKMELRCVGVEYIVDEDEVSSTRTKFPSLEQLELISLEHLKEVSKGNDIESFPRLQELQIGECSSLMIWQEDARYLKSLAFLKLYGLPKMVSLPKALKHLSSPYSLILANLPELTTIAACLTSSTSLIRLDIIYCPKLTSLPDSIIETKNLQTLWIERCPKLERLCEKEKGRDWHKIAHIPRVRIG